MEILKNEIKMSFAEAENKYPMCFICMIDMDDNFCGIPIAISRNKDSFEEFCAFTDKMQKNFKVGIAGKYESEEDVLDVID